VLPLIFDKFDSLTITDRESHYCMLLPNGHEAERQTNR